MRVALMAGISGKTGKELLQCLLNNRHYKRVVLFTRRDNRRMRNIHLSKILVDFNQLDTHIHEMEGVDDVFCLLGTDFISTHKLDDAEMFDLDYPLNLARASRNAGIRNFFLLNIARASHEAGKERLRKRAQLEAEIKKLGFENFQVFRVNGISDPVNPENALYVLRRTLSNIVNLLGRGLMDKMRLSPANLVAQKMVEAAVSENPVKFEYHPGDY